ncbi:hypothetical protein A2961_01765 [Candidatus Woesebacteria bacterium RIFCSPLOWO2_01_FULL_39_21]|uniref:Uncharacterized protein n=1 Tax=Candidatus Woesebacteria bacterium RIFCSPLOWO2_01_FULL_39_21 TaxID=1802519 RepID=A0A1F8BB55_9BACT|nr:MAG: hypothetical protein A2691_01420 [Candidatus Woesebacteria bacterium RIFCSPHIGHO2_01_FULL_39_23]OGM61276.1 MAG: hypothetical protein A2961_01765 [Candidatus Woesebacteria bacterium RIFCSPLOWO2_01_FULL_39_21]
MSCEAIGKIIDTQTARRLKITFREEANPLQELLEILRAPDREKPVMRGGSFRVAGQQFLAQRSIDYYS